MIQIKDTATRNLDKISKDYFKIIKEYVNKKLHHLNQHQRTFIESTLTLEKIITGTPEELNEINNSFLKIYEGSEYQTKDPNENLEKVFKFSWFSKSNNGKFAYDLASKLNFNTCPYCNRNYTVTARSANKSRITRPDFDHFFPQKGYPLLTLSFFNLIPSCLICNRTVKNQQCVKDGDYLNPYEEGFENTCKFNYLPQDTESAIGIGNKYKVKFNIDSKDPIKSKKCNNNVCLFKLEEIYEASHTTEISDLIRKHHVSNGKYLEELKKTFPQIGSFEELYRLAFGNYYENESLEKRPLSKMTKDMVEQLGFYFPDQ